MGFAIYRNGVYQGVWSRWDNPPRELTIGETIVECEAAPEVAQAIAADWPGFREAIQHSDALLRIANVNPARFVLVNTVMWQVASSPGLIPELVSNWNALAVEAQPTSNEILELNGIAADNNIPFQLDEQGLMG